MKRAGIVLLLMIMAGCLQNGQSKLTICCAGDSLMRPIPHHLREMLKSSKKKIKIRDWSQGGLNSQSYRRFLSRHYQSWRYERPDFILIQLGTNDVSPLLQNEYGVDDFKANLKRIIKNFRRFRGNKYKRPKIFMASIPLFYLESSSEEKKRLIEERVNPTIKETAREENIILVDNFSVLYNKTHLYYPDGVHPNSQGVRALAKNWLFWIRSELRKGS